METRSQEAKPFRIGWENHLCQWAWAMTACVSPDLRYWALSLILCVIWVKWFCFFGSWSSYYLDNQLDYKTTEKVTYKLLHIYVRAENIVRCEF